jgi:hypothetical protein
LDIVAFLFLFNKRRTTILKVLEKAHQVRRARYGSVNPVNPASRGLGGIEKTKDPPFWACRKHRTRSANSVSLP